MKVLKIPELCKATKCVKNHHFDCKGCFENLLPVAFEWYEAKNSLIKFFLIVNSRPTIDQFSDFMVEGLYLVKQFFALNDRLNIKNNMPGGRGP